MDFVELKVEVNAEFSDILVAELAEIGYESFVETDAGLDAYIAEDRFDRGKVAGLIRRYRRQADIRYAFSTLERINWNERWEKSYEPIAVDERCLVRAAFHPADERFDYQIVITPQMSFGTGHHETTFLMLSGQLRTEHRGKRVLDVGCGTGILAIMASLRGASRVVAVDVDEWAVENARENAERNHCENVTIYLGTIDQVAVGERFDLLLANINRNVLLRDIPAYADCLQPGGQLLVSGFYESDAEDIGQVAAGCRLVREEQRTKNQWACVSFRKEAAVNGR